MATIEEGLFNLWNTDPGVQAVLSPDASGTNCRLYPGHIPEEATLPAAAFARAGGRRGLNITGPDGLIRARFQISVASSDQEAKNGSGYDDCAIVLEALTNKAHGFSGALPNGVIVQQIQAMTEPIDDFNAEAKLYFRHQDIMVVFENPKNLPS
jgi:hypothetical protein